MAEFRWHPLYLLDPLLRIMWPTQAVPLTGICKVEATIMRSSINNNIVFLNITWNMCNPDMKIESGEFVWGTLVLCLRKLTKYVSIYRVIKMFHLAIMFMVVMQCFVVIKGIVTVD